MLQCKCGFVGCENISTGEALLQIFTYMTQFMGHVKSLMTQGFSVIFVGVIKNIFYDVERMQCITFKDA